MKHLIFFTFALLVSCGLTNDEITFCKLSYYPKLDSPEHRANCLALYDYNLDGCYYIPEGYGRVGQSFKASKTAHPNFYDSVTDQFGV